MHFLESYHGFIVPFKASSISLHCISQVTDPLLICLLVTDPHVKLAQHIASSCCTHYNKHRTVISDCKHAHIHAQNHTHIHKLVCTLPYLRWMLAGWLRGGGGGRALYCFINWCSRCNCRGPCHQLSARPP